NAHAVGLPATRYGRGSRDQTRAIGAFLGPPVWPTMWMRIHISGWTMKTIQMTIDDALLKAVDCLCRARKTTRSALIRDMLEAELRREKVRAEERRHAEGYVR